MNSPTKQPATGAGPRKIMVIRHAEKPVAGRVDGVRWRGQPDPASLTAMGWQRAGALVHFFETPGEPPIARPDHLFAVRFDRAQVGSSRRSKQTLRPLSMKTGLPVNDSFGEEQEDQLVRSFAALSGTVLVAWSHEHIQNIVAALGASPLTPGAWPDKRFDMVWVFDRQAGKTLFTQVPQRLLAGDSRAVISLNDKA